MPEWADKSSAHFLFLMGRILCSHRMALSLSGHILWLQKMPGQARIRPKDYMNMYLRTNSTARTHIVGVICLALPERA